MNTSSNTSVSLQPHYKFNINRHTLIITMDILIEEAQRTNYFSLMIYNSIISEQRRIIIEFLQPLTSIFLNIEMFQDSTILFEKIEELLTIILCSSKTIYTWGNLDENLYDFQIYGLFFYEKINQNNFINIQDIFKHWYNRLFHHNENCNQLINFVTMEGPLCKCFNQNQFKNK